MSESSISNYITLTTGLSFFDLLNEMRVGKTINFLLYTNLTMEELAEILGFVDSSHISKVFAARIGMKANDFRKTYQNVYEMCNIKMTRDAYDIVAYIYRNYAEDLTPPEHGGPFHISIKELNTILLYQVEKNFPDFLNFVRVNRASGALKKHRPDNHTDCHRRGLQQRQDPDPQLPALPDHDPGGLSPEHRASGQHTVSKVKKSADAHDG